MLCALAYCVQYICSSCTRCDCLPCFGDGMWASRLQNIAKGHSPFIAASQHICSSMVGFHQCDSQQNPLAGVLCSLGLFALQVKWEICLGLQVQWLPVFRFPDGMSPQDTLMTWQETPPGSCLFDALHRPGWPLRAQLH